jgi:acetylornithine deacetylase/succinyl-diaminopimelate desuccinylase-like protein
MKKAFEYIDKNFDRMVGELQEICKQPSIAARNIGMEETAKKVFEKMQSLGMNCQLIPVENGYPVLIGEIKGETDKTILFYNHYDVQPPEPLDKWTHPPFGAEIHDGKLYARGVSDNKGALYSRLQAIEAILATEGKLPVNVKFLVEGEEEIGSPNLEKFVKDHKDLLKADACIWENAFKDENDNPMARLGNKGMLYVELRVNTAATDFHSRMAPVIPNAAWRLVWALSTLKDPNENILIEGFYDKVRPIPPEELEVLKNMPSQEEKLKKRAGLKEFLGRVTGLEFTNKLYNAPTCTICGIESGYTLEGQKTVLPCTAMAKVDFRLVVDQDPDEIVKLLRKHLDRQGFSDIEISVLSKAKPSKTPVTTPFVDVLYESAAMVYDKPLVIEPTSAGTGPRFVFTDWTDMPIAAIGPGYSGSLNHAPDENIRIEDYREAIKHIIALLYCFAKK